MEFADFTQKIKTGVEQFLGEKAGVEIRNITKNNGVVLTGLTIMREEEHVSPTIYLESFFKEYKDGRSLGLIVYEIVKIYEDNRVRGDVNMNFFLEYPSVRGRVFQKLVNYEKNKEMLAGVPHVRFLDFAVVCYYAYMNDYLGRGSIQIDKEHLKHWDISADELFEDARRNTMEKLGVEIKGMDEIVLEMMAEKLDDLDTEQLGKMMDCAGREMPMYIMTIKGRYFGAVCLYYEEWLAEFGRRQGRDFYALPSSIHEVILVPAHGNEKKEDLRRMVREVNSEHVAAEEILSDNIYYFDLSANKLVLI